MNRQQRRAQERRQVERRGQPAPVPMVRMSALTLPEAELVAEALDAYRLTLNEDVPAVERTKVQAWAYERAGTIRDALQANIEARPWADISADRAPQ